LSAVGKPPLSKFAGFRKAEEDGNTSGFFRIFPAKNKKPKYEKRIFDQFTKIFERFAFVPAFLFSLSVRLMRGYYSFTNTQIKISRANTGKASALIQ
jgi:hypothetical protein